MKKQYPKLVFKSIVFICFCIITVVCITLNAYSSGSTTKYCGGGCVTPGTCDESKKCECPGVCGAGVEAKGHCKEFNIGPHVTPPPGCGGAGTACCCEVTCPTPTPGCKGPTGTGLPACSDRPKCPEGKECKEVNSACDCVATPPPPPPPPPPPNPPPPPPPPMCGDAPYNTLLKCGGGPCSNPGEICYPKFKLLPVPTFESCECGIPPPPPPPFCDEDHCPGGDPPTECDTRFGSNEFCCQTDKFNCHCVKCIDTLCGCSGQNCESPPPGLLPGHCSWAAGSEGGDPCKCWFEKLPPPPPPVCGEAPYNTLLTCGGGPCPNPGEICYPKIGVIPPTFQGCECGIPPPPPPCDPANCQGGPGPCPQGSYCKTSNCTCQPCNVSNCGGEGACKSDEYCDTGYGACHCEKPCGWTLTGSTDCEGGCPGARICDHYGISPACKCCFTDGTGCVEIPDAGSSTSGNSL